jgi:hypothetical protein
MNRQRIFRDDDVGLATEKSFARFLEVDALFKKHWVRHTVAVICNGLSDAYKLVQYINDNDRFDVQVPLLGPC